jgi:3-dehydroquinate dehydratase
VGVISGLGPVGYELALTAAIRYMEKDSETNRT